MKKNKVSIIILSVILIVLLVLLIGMLIFKFSGGDSTKSDDTISYEKLRGTWYQQEKNENVYLRIKDVEGSSLIFDFNSMTLFSNVEAKLENNEATIEINNENGKVKLNIKVEEKKISLTILESENVYFSNDETYIFEVNQ